MAADDGLVRAAGGIPWRPGPDGAVEVLVVHRPKYDDWSFPKGKLDPGETWEQAAVREVFEESGIVGVLGAELEPTDYRDRFGRPKRVRWWAMQVAADAGFEPHDEVDERRWLAPDAAAPLLTYERDGDLLAALVAAVSASGGSSARSV
ncbi:MAG: NUDIX hydrolase [Acidimicrobiia bacterium]